MKKITLIFVLFLMTASLAFAQFKPFDKDGNPIPLAPFYIKNTGTGKYLTVQNNSTADAARIVQADLTGEANQKFTLVDLESVQCYCDAGVLSNGDNIYRNTCHAYKIQSVSSGKYLQINGGSKENGAELIQWPLSNAIKQRFIVDGWFIWNQESCKVLEAPTAADNIIKQNTMSASNTRQRFVFETMPLAKPPYIVRNGKMENPTLYACKDCGSNDQNNYNITILGGGLVGWHIIKEDYMQVFSPIIQTDGQLNYHVMFKYISGNSKVTAIRLMRGIEIKTIKLDREYNIVKP
jgi:hypothetical protein